MKKFLSNFFLIFLFTYSLPCISELNTIDNAKVQNKTSEKRRLVKILSIDGGGVRGIIPANVLAELERRMSAGENIAEKFDIISGTSAGGIIALMLTAPNNDGKPKYTASFVATAMSKFSSDVFSRSVWQRIKSGSGWLGEKYDGELLKEKLKDYFHDLKLSQALTNVIVPTYEIAQDKTFFFKSSRAIKELPQDCDMRALAYATAAAPTYFSPAQLVDGTKKRTLTLIDGGVAANNPTLAAAVYAVELYGRDIDLFIVSLGTGTSYGAQTNKLEYRNVKNIGKLGWAEHIVPLLMYAGNAVTDYEMYYVLNFNKPQYYFRIQTVLEPKNSEMDNVDPKNLEALQQYSSKLIKQYDKELTYIAKVLSNGYFPHPEEKNRQAFR